MEVASPLFAYRRSLFAFAFRDLPPAGSEKRTTNDG